jgi:hypothetical protein
MGDSMNRFLHWLTGFLPARIINDGQRDYLERYYVTTIFGMRIYLHRFIGSDPDRGLHDHPWSWAFSLILAGFYYEQRRDGIRRRRWGNWLTGDSFHRVILPRIDGNYGIHLEDQEPEYQPCWTLFIHRAKKNKSWGFLRDISAEDAHGLLWTPFASHEPNWWLTAPTGKQLREQHLST